MTCIIITWNPNESDEKPEAIYRHASKYFHETLSVMYHAFVHTQPVGSVRAVHSSACVMTQLA